MKCLTAATCRAWLAPSGLCLEDGVLLAVVDRQPSHTPLYAVIERKGSPLPEFCRDALDWLPAGRERLLLTSGWSSYPPDHKRLFETIRRGCGATESLADAPGHLFAATKTAETDYEDRPDIDVDEESMAMWLMALMLEWTWDGFACAEGCRDIILLGDGYVRFESHDLARMAEVEALLARWGLTSRADFPWIASAKPNSH